MDDTVTKVTELVEPLIEERGLELFGLDLRPEGRGPVLRLLVDREGGIDLDEITGLTRELSDLLDLTEPLPGGYTLEVSSPGINRPLRTLEHFRRHRGKRVRVRSRVPLGGRRNFVGRLLEATAAGIVLAEDGGEETRVPLAEIEKANYEHEFTAEDFGKRPSTPPAPRHGA